MNADSKIGGHQIMLDLLPQLADFFARGQCPLCPADSCPRITFVRCWANIWQQLFLLDYETLELLIASVCSVSNDMILAQARLF